MLDLTTTQHVEKFCNRISADKKRTAIGGIPNDLNGGGYETMDLTERTCKALYTERVYGQDILVHFDCCLPVLLNTSWLQMAFLRIIAERAARTLVFEVRRLTYLLAESGISEIEIKKLPKMKSALDKLAKWANTDVPPLSKRKWDDFFGKFLLVERNK